MTIHHPIQDPKVKEIIELFMGDVSIDAQAFDSLPYCRICTMEESEFMVQIYGDTWFAKPIQEQKTVIEERVAWIKLHYNEYYFAVQMFKHKSTGLSRIVLGVYFEDPADAVHFKLIWG